MKKKFKKFGIIGAGAWGTALAAAISTSQVKTILWAKEKEVIDSILQFHENKIYLPNIKLPKNLEVTNDMKLLSDCDILLLVCPAQFTRSIANKLKEEIATDIPLILCSKGIEQNSLMLQSEIIEEVMEDSKVGILAGPTFASEVARLLPASINIASLDLKLAKKLSDSLDGSNLSIHIMKDMIGAQIGGIVKNVIAIGCGIASGYNLGENMHASLISQGLKEATILTKEKDGEKNSLLDFCGAGDMVLTCSSKQSRNFSFGIELAKGEKVQDIISKSGKVIEGYASAKPLFELSKKLNIELPLCRIIYEILYENSDPRLICSRI